ncbi:MAG: MFS transporter [Cytophagaceae bacterium]|jgi:FHS family L-fucose permease-like MFS transporter|nr:MFS transporter [Cytophagaceae bacterium]
MLSKNPEINYPKVFLILATLFFMWGLITVINISLMNEIIALFHLSFTEFTVLNVALYASYFIASYPTGFIVQSIGFRKSMIMGAVIAAIGCFLFYPATEQHSYRLLLVSLMVMGIGFTFLQISANPYIALLGIRGKGAAKLTFIQAFNSLGTVIAPLLAYGLIHFLVQVDPEAIHNFTPAEIIEHKKTIIQVPYLFFGTIWLLLSILLFLSELPKINILDKEPLNKRTPDGRRFIWQYPQVRYAFVSLFLYVGAEVYIASYLEIRAASLMPYYWGLAMLGRFMGSGFLYLNTSPRKLMQVSGLGAVVLLLIYMFVNRSHIFIGAEAGIDPALYLLVIVGFFNSILWPTVFTMGIDGMGRHTIQASAFIVAAIIGGAIIPYTIFYLDLSLWLTILILAAAYICVAWFGLKGSRYEKENNFY